MSDSDQLGAEPDSLIVSPSAWDGLDQIFATTNTQPQKPLTLEDLEKAIDELRKLEYPPPAISPQKHEEMWNSLLVNHDIFKVRLVDPGEALYQRLKHDPIRFKVDEEYRRKAPTDDEIAGISPDPREFKQRFCPDSTFLDE